MSIIDNKKAFHDYFIEERFEAGMVLEGWEVKSLRAGRGQIKEAYVIVRNGEVFLFGAHISALPTASTILALTLCAHANCCCVVKKLKNS